MNIRIKFKLQDLWIGVYWEEKYDFNKPIYDPLHYTIITNLYICIIPCFPICISWKKLGECEKNYL